MKVEICSCHSFLPDLIDGQGTVFDFGLNNGGFARAMAARCGKVIGFEPDPGWHDNLALPPNVEYHPKAVAAQHSTLRLNLNRDSCPSLHYAQGQAQVVEVEAITLREALAFSPGPVIDLMKLDIEGEELGVLGNAPEELLAGIKQITVEFHDFIDPTSLPAIHAVIGRMESLGFHAIKFSWSSYGDMLFVNQRLQPLTTLDRIWMRARYKYISGLGRLLRRWMGK